MKHSILVFALISILFSCQSESISVQGYEIVTHKLGDGIDSYPGSHVMFNFESFDHEGNLLQSMTGENGNKPQVQIPQPEDEVPYSAFLEVLKQVSVGDSLSLFVPFDSLQGAPPKLEGTELEYRLLITHILDSIEYQKHADAEKYAAQDAMKNAQILSEEKVESANKDLIDYRKGTKQIITSTNGIKIMMIEEGRGNNAAPGDVIVVDYVGLFKDGKKFDDSFHRMQPFAFEIGQGQVIPGWEEGFQYLSIGSKALLDIPYELAYGEQGSPPSIPAKSDLIFVVEVNAIN